VTDQPVDLELLARADAAAARAYAPYSRFHVGCAVSTRDGNVVEGVNVENAAYPLGVCAERAAFARAISEGHLLEMGVERVVFRSGDRVVTMTPDELLPASFGSSELP